VGVVHAGRIGVSHGDETMELGPGDTYVLEPGHDAWVIGDTAFVGYEFDSKAADSYATVDS
jgi:hypothetical protein